jgi:two-component system response regulator LytT
VIESGNLKVLIVDDEKPARRDARRMLGRIGGVDIVGEAGDGIEAAKMIRELSPDLVLLDIQMPGHDGFQVLAGLSDLEELPHVVFLTAYDQYALKAFEVHAVDYILKPIDEERLTGAIGRVKRLKAGIPGRPDLEALLRTVGALPGRLAVRHKNTIIMVDVEDVLYVTVSHGDVVVVTEELEGSASYKSLDQIQHDLPAGRFVRVHRSYLANLGKIHEITPWLSGGYRLRMGHGDGPVIPLSRARSRELRKYIQW